MPDYRFPIKFPFKLGPQPAEQKTWYFPLTFPLFLGPYAGDDVVIIRKRLERNLNLTKDDNETAATLLVTLRFPESKLRELVQTYDVVITVGRESESEERQEPLGVVTASFNIETWSIDHKAVKGLTIRQKAKKEVRRIMNEFPLGSFQKMGSARDDDRLLSSPPLYHTIQSIQKTRYEEF